MGSEKNIFSLKREADLLLSRVEAPSATFEDIEDAATKLAGMGSRAPLFVANRLKNAHSTHAVKNIASLIELLNDFSYAEILKEILLSSDGKKLPDESKLEILAALKSYEPSALNGTLSTFFEDPAGAYLRWAAKVLSDFDQKEYRALSLLEEFLAEYPNKNHLLKQLISTAQDAAVPLLALLAESDNLEISFFALQSLVTIGSERSLSVLKQIKERAWQKETADEAARLLRKMQFAGRNLGSATPLPENRKTDLKRLTGYCSPVDAMGNLNLCIVSKKEDGRHDTFFLVLNDEVGIVDACGAKGVDSTEMTEIISEAGEEMVFQKMDVALCLALVGHGLYRNKTEKIPLPSEFHYRKEMLAGHFSPELFVPFFRCSLLKEILRDNALIPTSGSLLEREEFKAWAISTPLVFDYAERLGRLTEKGETFVRPDERNLIKNFCRKVIYPMREQIRRRLFILAAFMERSNAPEETVKTALSVALHLGRKPPCPLEEIPFFAGLAKQSMRNCLAALENGFDMRDFDGEMDELDE